MKEMFLNVLVKRLLFVGTILLFMATYISMLYLYYERGCLICA
jgi:hypothetical protein